MGEERAAWRGFLETEPLLLISCLLPFHWLVPQNFQRRRGDEKDPKIFVTGYFSLLDEEQKSIRDSN